MKLKHTHLAALAALALAGPASATTLLTDNFDGSNQLGATFNTNNATQQGGTLAPATYNVTYQAGNDWQTQNGAGRLLVSNSNGGGGYGSVSLDNDFATQANAANKALQVSFNILDVYYGSGVVDNGLWVQFNIGSSQHALVNSAAATVGIDFNIGGGSEVFRSGAGPQVTTYGDGDLVTVTLSNGAGGSAFNGTGSVANVKIGATDVGTWTLTQQTSAYLTFAGFQYSQYLNTQVIGEFDNLNITLVPEPHAPLLGGLGMLALLRRRR